MIQDDIKNNHEMDFEQDFESFSLNKNQEDLDNSIPLNEIS